MSTRSKPRVAPPRKRGSLIRPTAAAWDATFNAVNGLTHDGEWVIVGHAMMARADLFRPTKPRNLEPLADGKLENVRELLAHAEDPTGVRFRFAFERWDDDTAVYRSTEVLGLRVGFQAALSPPAVLWAVMVPGKVVPLGVEYDDDDEVCWLAAPMRGAPEYDSLSSGWEKAFKKAKTPAAVYHRARQAGVCS